MKKQKQQLVEHKIVTGLKIQAPAPPVVAAFGKDYEAYLSAYAKYESVMERIQKKIRTAKLNKANPLSRAGVSATLGQVILDLREMAGDLKDAAEDTGTTFVMDGLEKAREKVHDLWAELEVKPLESVKEPTKVVPTGPKKATLKKAAKRAAKQVKEELALATDVAKLTKVATRAGQKVVKTTGGWKIVTGKKVTPEQIARETLDTKLLALLAGKRQGLYTLLSVAIPDWKSTVPNADQMSWEVARKAVGEAGTVLARSVLNL